jgi:hypothetical protein
MTRSVIDELTTNIAEEPSSVPFVLKGLVRLHEAF